MPEKIVIKASNMKCMIAIIINNELVSYYVRSRYEVSFAYPWTGGGSG